ncbi:MAG: SDR family NAD(P)-dependent oxidoreductase [Fibrobacter sp.]|nr:SDR family NAD(P)-dependent oxidoreductase [Fibrobacter sp.]
MARKTQAVLITGGAKRLGLCFARKALEMGYSVIVHYRSSLYDAKIVLFKSAKHKDKVFFVKHDLSTSPETLIDKCSDLPVDLCGLVNNASLFTTGNLQKPDHLEEILRVNVIAPLRLSTRFCELAGKGWIINITDSNISRPNHNFQNYRISKLFLEEITRQQAFLFAPSIRVNAIAPGAMLPSDAENTQYFHSLSEKIPLGKTGDLRSLTDTFEFLVNTPYLTGEVIRVDGGWHLSA